MSAHGTKYYSDRQEKMVASYLTSEFLPWHQVTGSGSRPNLLGDVVCESWLGECKTHERRTDKVTFVFSVVNKIDVEAISSFKKFALFVDDGSQLSQNTAVLFKSEINKDTNIIDVNDKSSIRLSIKEIKENEPIYLLKGNSLYEVVTLSTFKYLLDGQEI